MPKGRSKTGKANIFTRGQCRGADILRTSINTAVYYTASSFLPVSRPRRTRRRYIPSHDQELDNTKALEYALDSLCGNSNSPANKIANRSNLQLSPLQDRHHLQENLSHPVPYANEPLYLQDGQYSPILPNIAARDQSLQLDGPRQSPETPDDDSNASIIPSSYSNNLVLSEDVLPPQQGSPRDKSLERIGTTDESGRRHTEYHSRYTTPDVGFQGDARSEGLTQDGLPSPDYSVYRRATANSKKESTEIKPRKRRVYWTSPETATLKDYMRQYPQRYADILAHDKSLDGKGILIGRSQGELKDKARNMAIVMIKSRLPVPEGFKGVIQHHTKMGQMLRGEGYTW